jgi:hypothetical protein
MKRWLAALALIAGVALVGCGKAAGPFVPQPVSTDWPTLPATVTADANAPALPAGGPLGRGALLLRDEEATVHTTHLVLEDGRQFVLPDGPTGEAGPEGEDGGRNNLATLSPDGWWLGLRTGTTAWDQSYQVRSLQTGSTVDVTGVPQAWSADSHWLLLARQPIPGTTMPAGPGWTLLDLRTGQLRHLPDATQANAVLPSGDPLRVGADESSISITDAEGTRSTIAFAGGEGCWCPTSTTPVVSPDGLRLSVVLWSNVPGPVWTGPEPSAPAGWPDTPFVRAIAVYDLATRKEVRRTTFELAGNPELIEDRGSQVLVRIATYASPQQVLALDPVAGTAQVVFTYPTGLEAVLLPGELSHLIDTRGER